MRIVINGQQAFGKACLESILNEGKDEVVAVYTAPDVDGKPIDPIKKSALDAGLEVRQPSDFESPEVLQELRSWNADLMLLAYVTIFVPEQARNIPKNGTICFHPSLLPLHRGPSSINWPIIWGANKTGLTIFWPDDGLDEGEVLLQKEVDILPDDTLGTVYFDKIFPLGVNATLEAIDLIRSGKAPKIPQDETKATYESWCRRANAEIDWSRSANEVYNLIRGCNPQPGAWTTYNGEEVQIFDCELTVGSGRFGRVCAIDDTSFTINSGLGGIRISRVRLGKSGKIKSAEFIQDRKIELGSRFGS
ncbi:MAG: methionyl-tRNA formyltransferase [Pseudomonadota bacterium]|nr:methionyl-tRNA formyltransferase [Pseudomonadota bacterium]MEC9100930.1 methionyl-tRNA formyltransferase [Pseudomonadota bacterium]